MAFSTDKLTSFIGVALGALHQVGIVGVFPTTRQDWFKTAFSIMLALFGYYTNKR